MCRPYSALTSCASQGYPTLMDLINAEASNLFLVKGAGDDCRVGLREHYLQMAKELAAVRAVCVEATYNAGGTRKLADLSQDLQVRLLCPAARPLFFRCLPACLSLWLFFKKHKRNSECGPLKSA